MEEWDRSGGTPRWTGARILHHPPPTCPVCGRRSKLDQEATTRRHFLRASPWNLRGEIYGGPVAHTKEHPQCTFHSTLGTAEGGSTGPDENETDERRADKTAWSRTIAEWSLLSSQKMKGAARDGMSTTSLFDQVQSAHVNEDMKPWRGHSCPSPYWNAQDELDAPDSNRLDDLVRQSAFSVTTPSVHVEGRRSPRIPSITQPSALLLFGTVISTRDVEMEPQTHTVNDWDTANPHAGELSALCPPETRKREPRTRDMCKVSNTTHENIDKDQLAQYERKKLPNKQAARRSRSKKAGEIERLRQWVGKLLEENHALKSHIKFVNGQSMHWRPQEFAHLCHSAQSAQTAVDSMLNNAQIAAVPGILPWTYVELTYLDLVHSIISEKNATVVHDGCSNLEMGNLSSGRH